MPMNVLRYALAAGIAARADVTHAGGVVVIALRWMAHAYVELRADVGRTVEERLGFVDHLTDSAVTVTVTAAIINVTIGVGDVIDTERLMADAEAAVERAKRQGRNRVERVDGYSGPEPSRPAS